MGGWLVRPSVGIGAFALVGAVVACGAFSGSDEASQGPSDAGTLDVPIIEGSPDGGPVDAGNGDAATCDTTADFGAPVRLAEIASTYGESTAWLTPDELSMIYVEMANPAGSQVGQLVRVTRADRGAPFGNRTVLPVSLASGQAITGMFGGTFSQDAALGLFVTATGTFQQGTYATTLGVAVKSAGGYAVYAAPALADGIIGTPMEPWPTRDGELYVTNGSSIYRRTAGFDGGVQSQAVELKELGAPPAYTRAPVVSADGLTIYFSSTRDGDGGQTPYENVYVAKRPNIGASWGFPTKMLFGLTATSTVRPTWLSPDNCRLYMLSDKGVEPWHLYVAERGR